MPHCNISSRSCEIAQAVEAGQRAMFKAAARDHGLTLNVLAAETGISLSTLRCYAPARPEMPASAMPVYVMLKLARVIPNHLASLMTEPGGKILADADPEETDIDDLARSAVDILQRYVAARHPDSPGGIRIVHNEVDDIKRAAAGLQDRAGKVAAV